MLAPYKKYNKLQLVIILAYKSFLFVNELYKSLLRMTKKLTIDAFCCLDNAKLGIKYMQRKHYL